MTAPAASLGEALERGLEVGASCAATSGSARSTPRSPSTSSPPRAREPSEPFFRADYDRAVRERARAVVIGGGVGGASILYWLTRLGWDDLVRERAVELDGVHHHPGQAERAAELADEPGRVERRAARQVGALDEHDVVPAESGEPVEDGAAADAAADHDRTRTIPHAQSLCGATVPKGKVRRGR